MPPPPYAVPVKRRKPRLERPKVTSGRPAPEPFLAPGEYEEILSIIRNMARVMEYSPSTFHNIDEEHLRFHFLVHLNGQYEGQATGETFNFQGKTDILIRVDGKNVFVAECKFWKGPKAFDDAVTQLLGYLSWRDTKTALLVFNKTKNSIEVRKKMHSAMESRPEHRRTVSHEQDGDSRYVFGKPDDTGTELIITTQVYDVPDTESDGG